jgi:SAM-dependent methyltransferase
MENTCCDFCGSDDAEILYIGAGWKHPVPQDCALVRCRHCGLMYLNPRPTPDEINAFYPDDYPAFRPAVEDERSRLMHWARRRKLVRRRQVIEKYSGYNTGRILDVGCGTGLFLHEMEQAGWQVTGIEPTSSAALYARTRFSLEIFQGFLEQTDYPPQTFDVITFWDVLEHTYSPVRALRYSAELLRPGGIVAINVPNWQSPDRGWFGPHWIGLDPPRHLFIFTCQTLTALLNQAGFQPLAWVCFMPSYFPFIISLERWLAVRIPRLAKPLHLVLNLPGVRYLFEPYFTAMNWLKRGGIIAVFARKITS